MQHANSKFNLGVFVIQKGQKYVKLFKFLTSTMTTLSMHLSPAAAILPISRAISSSSPFLCLEILGSKLRCSSWCSWCSSWCSWWSWWSGSSPKSLALGRARLPPTNGNTLARFRPSRICSSDRYSSCWASWDLRLWQYGLWSFQKGGTKLERFFQKNQHTQRKLLNFEFWINGELSKIGHHFSNKLI